MRIVYLSDHRSVSSPGNHRTILVKQSAKRVGAGERGANGNVTESPGEKVGEDREVASGSWGLQASVIHSPQKSSPVRHELFSANSQTQVREGWRHR